MIILIIILWLIGAITAYPRHKKYCLEEFNRLEEINQKWTIGDMLWAIMCSLFFWWFIWFYYLFERFTNWDWLNKESKF